MTARKPLASLWPLYLLSDVAAVVLAYAGMLYVRFYAAWGRDLFGALNRRLGVREPGDLGPDFLLFYVDSAPRIVFLLALSLGWLYALLDLYAPRRFVLRRSPGPPVLLANAVALALYYSYFYARYNVFHPRTVFITVVALNVVFALGLRRLLQGALRGMRRRGWDPCPVLLIGGGEDARYLESYIEAERPNGMAITGRAPGPPSDGRLSEWEDRVRTAADAAGARLLLCADPGVDTRGIMGLLRVGDATGRTVKVLSRELDVLAARARLSMDLVHGEPLAHFGLPASGPIGCRVRSWARKAAALGLLAALSPLLLLLALLVRLSGPGPVFFVQERIGLNRVPFRMYKFRTMHHLADEAQASVEEFNESPGALFKIRNDPRVTRVGRFLRRFSLDELPQLVNVLRGEMAFVGPRPLPRRDFERYEEDWHYLRHEGLPGLTCLWQVSGRSDIDFHNMCILDIYYLRNRNWILDAKILLRTVDVVLFGRGAY